MLLAMRQAQERIERLEQAIRNRRARRILVECSWSYQHPPGDCHQAFNPE
jgi:hypothetical protein